MKNSNDPYDIVRNVYKQVSDFLPTITANQFDYYKKNEMPVSKTIMNRTGKSWNAIIRYIGLPEPLERNTLARISDSLHYLEKLMKKSLNIGWEEKNFKIEGRNFRPDSYFIERFLANDNRFFILDVKLCVSATPITIYKYLPLFENSVTLSNRTQLTFFDEWLPKEAIQKPFVHYDDEGQSSMALENNVLYICYLIGDPKSDAIPCSMIRGKFSNKKKKLPENMEVRYVDFLELPKFYCDIANIEYEEEKISSYLNWAKSLKNIVCTLPCNAELISQEIANRIRCEMRNFDM